MEAKTSVSESASYDFFNLDPVSLQDPHPFYELARRAGPVYRDPHTGCYILTSYDDVVQVSRNKVDFSACVSATGPITIFPGPLQGSDEEMQACIHEYVDRIPGMVPFLSYDPPRHTRFRKILGRLFTPRRIERVAPSARQLANELIDDFIDAGEVEFVSQFGDEFSFRVIVELFGLPPEDKAALKFKTDSAYEGASSVGNAEAMAQFSDSSVEGGADPLAVMMERLGGLFAGYIAERRTAPRDDVLSEIANGQFEDTGELPSIEELLPVVLQVFGAGTTTTGGLLSRGVQILAERPDLVDELRADPALVDNFVEETLRYDSSVKGLFRLAKVDTTIGGVAIPAGSIIMLCYHAADRDPEHFPDPTTFDLHRANSRTNLAFGHGPHLCLGAPIARLESRIAFQVLLERLDNIRYAPDNAFEQTPSFVIRGVTSLNLRFDPRKAVPA
jgi:cytochrome P450 family 150 subfamily A5